jgi:hypothetical protein
MKATLMCQLNNSRRFPIHRWLGIHAMDKRTMIRALHNQQPAYTRMPNYIVHVLTGSKTITHDLNIQANVYLQIFCTNFDHVYGPILLDRSSNTIEPFRKGQIDEFHIYDVPSCGDINKIRLWHDGGKITSWHCEW